MGTVAQFPKMTNAARLGAAHGEGEHLSNDDYKPSASESKARWARIEEAEAAAWGEMGGHYGIAVLFALRLHAGAADAAWPSLDTIARVSRVSRRKVIDLLSAAKEAGLIRVESRKPSGTVGRPTNVYHLSHLISGAPRPNSSEGDSKVSGAERPIFAQDDDEVSGAERPISGVSGAAKGDLGRGEGGIKGAGRPGTVTTNSNYKQLTTKEPPKAPRPDGSSCAEPCSPSSGSAPPLPQWTAKIRTPDGVSRREVMDAVLEIIGEITGRTPDPHRSGTSARPVLALWRALEYPPLDEFVSDAKAVAVAARECPEPLFARDIRAEGWVGGTDRQRAVTTLLQQARWDERLAAARAWGGGRPSYEPLTDPHSWERHGIRKSSNGAKRWCSRAGAWIDEGDWTPREEGEA